MVSVPKLVMAGLLFVALPVLAHEGATGVVKDRMDMMERMAKAMKDIRRHIVESRDFPSIAREATRIAASAQRLPQLFPPGSNGRPSDALVSIWQQSPKFQAEADRLYQEANKLAQSAASDDPKGIAAQYRSLGQVCLDCHQTFRAKR